MANTMISKSLQGVTKGLSDRQREVLYGRFGLDKSGKTQTLESLGKRFGVTRERVRQIEASAIQSIRDKVLGDPSMKGVVDASKKELAAAGGVMKKSELLSTLRSDYPDLNENHMNLILAASKEFFAHDGDKDFHPFYYTDKNALKNATGFISQWIGTLRSEKSRVFPAGYETKLTSFIKNKGASEGQAKNYLSISKKIHKNPFGEIGLTEWPEIRPKTIRDRIYVVLKKRGEPVHFQDIARFINEAGFDEKIALASTVHNELIKDPRFVLVGRGMYGLAEQGYEKGTAREIIQKVLKKHGPMKSKEIVDAIQKERFFKYNTILVNLQNRNYFERMPDGTYQVRES